MARSSILLATALAALTAPLAAPASAEPQAWKEYAFPDAGFSVQFPLAPAASQGAYHGKTGATVPARTWSAEMDGVSYAITVADFGNANIDGQAVMADAIAALKDTGEIKVDTSERVDRNYGHDITLAGKDGSRSAIAIFFADGHLYELVGKALPPNVDAETSKTARFQQTLVFIDSGGRAPRRPDDGLGGGGPGGRGPGGPGFGPPGGRRGPPPPGAFEDCKGKKEGEVVQHTTPEGKIAATCVNGPQGLFARPNGPGF